VPELDERDLEGVPLVALSAIMALFDQLEACRPLLSEELSTMMVVQQVREGRNQLIEERFGRTSRVPSPGPSPENRWRP